MPHGTDAVRLAARLDRVAHSLATGRRETLQRFIPIARHAAADAARRLALLRFLLADALAEAAKEGEHSATALAMLVRIAAAVGTRGEVDRAALHSLAGEVLTLAPRLRRRRNIHGHGQVAADRRLLLARAILDDVKCWGRNGGGWYTLWLTVSYAMSDYDRDHFVMLGPRVEDRVRRLAGWISVAGGAPAHSPGPRSS